MAIDRRDHDTTERVDRYERERMADSPRSYVAPGPSNVNVGPSGGVSTAATSSAVLMVTRIVTLLFTVIEVLLLIRFVLKLLGANAQQPLVDGLYRVTEPLVRPFQGIFPQPAGAIDLPALLAIVFFFLLGALVVAVVRAVMGARTTY